MGHMKILVIDACETSRARTAEALRELTNVWIHDSVGTVDDAMRALDGAEVVVTEAELPDGDYLDVIGAARRRTPPAIVVFSRSEAPDLGRRSIAAGADQFVPASAGLGELQRAVLKAAPRRRRQGDTERHAILGRVTAGVAHDLANYLGVVDASIAIAQRHATDPGSRDELARARRAVDSTLGLLHTLLAYARGAEPTPVLIDLRAIVERVVDRFGRAIPTDVLVVLDLAAELPPIRGVPAEIEQLLLNLVLNACDAMPNGGELRISVGAEVGDVIRLEIADRGGGVPPNAAGASGVGTPSSKRDRGGEGLGLGVVRSVADRHSAALRLLHRAGGGTRVLVMFPVAESAA